MCSLKLTTASPAVARLTANRFLTGCILRYLIEGVLASLIKQFRDIELAEDALQEAVVAALINWPEKDIPERPLAWLMQTAKRKAIDRLRRSSNYDLKQQQIAVLLELENSSNDEPDEISIDDERLRLIFTCCHPALAESAQIALTLHTLCGLTTRQIAKAFLLPETTMAQRLVRAKRKIKMAGIPYQVPAADKLSARLDTVLAVVYLIFTEGHRSTDGSTLMAIELCDEAIRLGDLLNQLLPAQAEVLGLLSLMYFHHSRYLARIDGDGNPVSLRRQNRQLWIKPHIQKGDVLLHLATSLKQLGLYQIQAALSAVHAQAQSYEKTDWQQIILLYDKLYQYQPSPVVLINKAVAVSYAETPAQALKILLSIENHKELSNYQPLYAAKADILKRLDRNNEAKNCFQRAIDLSNNAAEIKYLTDQLAKVDSAP